MAFRIPLVQSAGQVQQLQAADDLDLTVNDLLVENIIATGNVAASGNVSGQDVIAADDLAGKRLTLTSSTADPASVLDVLDNLGATTFQLFCNALVAKPNLFMGRVGPSAAMTGTHNVGISEGASIIADDMTDASNNVLIGREPGRDLTTGDNNICIGAFAGRLMTVGLANTFIGTQSGGLAVITGSANVGLGQGSLEDLTSGNNNFGLGVNAGRNITDGAQNTLIGVNAGDAIIGGDFNTGIGTNAVGSVVTTDGNTGIGDAALENTTGAENVGIGRQAGHDATSGNENTFIGTDAGNATGQKTDPTGQIVIGANAFSDTDNQAVLGSTAITSTILRGTVAGGGVQIVNGTTAEALHVYNTSSSSTSYERLTIAWDTNVAEIQTEKGSGGGSARALALGTDGTVRTTINTDGTIASGSCFQPAKVIYGYGSGTNYVVTATSAEVNEGTDSAITIDQAGTYKVSGMVALFYNAATFAASRTITLKLRRTNNTATDLANSQAQMVTGVVTTHTFTTQMHVHTVAYTTANTDDRIALFIDVSVVPGAGQLEVYESSIVAERIA